MNPPSVADAGARPASAWRRSRRLALREFSIDDLDAITALHRDARLNRLLLDEFPLQRRAVARLFLEGLETFYRRHPGLGIWHAGRTDTDDGSPAMVGWFSLLPMPGREGALEIGARLLPAAWGGGLALEGASLLLGHAFHGLGVESVWGTCHPDNRSAVAAMLALGFEPRGLIDYQGRDAHCLRIDLNAWRTARDIPLATRLRGAARAIRSMPGCPGGQDDRNDRNPDS